MGASDDGKICCGANLMKRPRPRWGPAAAAAQPAALAAAALDFCSLFLLPSRQLCWLLTVNALDWKPAAPILFSSNEGDKESSLLHSGGGHPPETRRLTCGVDGCPATATSFRDHFS